METDTCVYVESLLHNMTYHLLNGKWFRELMKGLKHLLRCGIPSWARWEFLIRTVTTIKKCSLSCYQNKNNLSLFISWVVVLVQISVDKLKYFHGFRSCRVFNEDIAFWTDPKTSDGFTWFWDPNHVSSGLNREGHWCSLLKQYQDLFVSNTATAKVLFSQRRHKRPSPWPKKGDCEVPRGVGAGGGNCEEEPRGQAVGAGGGPG